MPGALRLVLADDLTGTLEVGAILKQAGRRVRIGIGEIPAVEGDEVAVIDCQTRRLGAEAAMGRYAEILRAAALPAEELYVKVDSTLRGNVAAALQAVLAHYPETEITFCPAYPSQGRTVVGGRVLVHGASLRARSSADECAEPVGSGVIRELLSPLGRRVRAYDAETEEELRARWTGGVVMAGSAGLLAARFPRQAGAGVMHGALAGRRWLVACGSMNPATQGQLAESPWAVLRYPATQEEAAERLEADGGVVVATPAERCEEDVMSWLAAMARGSGATGLIVFGGDTAASILAVHGIRSLEAAGEILPGVPCSWVQLRGAAAPLVTKAGGFGAPGLLSSLISEINKA
ncbi:MAG: hypothetical protein IPP47_09260 [Bryobacterales bacterium]|nr:hypothetical protein [Bryobacterales bacterium]